MVEPTTAARPLLRAAVTALLLSVLWWPLVSRGVEPLPRTTRASVSSDEVQSAGGHALYGPALSPGGRLVAFTSAASNLVPGDTNDVHDVFVRDRVTGRTERISVSSDDAQGDGDSAFASFSADGRYVGFHSLASNLVPGDTNGFADVFVHDRITGVTERVSVSSDEAQGNGDSVDAQLSADGRYVAFFSAASNFAAGDNGLFDVFVRDRLAGTTERVSVYSPAVGHELMEDDSFVGNGDSFSPAISGDGRYVAFHSGASNLVDNDTNAWADAFVHDRLLGVTRRVSVGFDGSEANGDSAHPAISADGRYVAYHTAASNVVPLALDNNSFIDVVVYDQVAGLTTRASIAPPGTAGIFGASADGDSFFPAVNAEGTLVAFFSSATNLAVVGDANGPVFDVFVNDRISGLTWPASRSTGGQWGNGQSFHPALDATMNAVAFTSSASNLVSGDTNNRDDVFVRERVAPPDLSALPTTTTIPIPPLPTTTSIPLPPLPTTTSIPLPPSPLECLPPDPLDVTIGDVFGCAGQPPPPVPPCAFFDPITTSPRDILACFLP